ncbi:MAG TPA: glycosyltransferase family 4 protein [Actinomycetota bacterium]|nr:glycosyltransferase family 4 protein [Actinomycetota bacterium]
MTGDGLGRRPNTGGADIRVLEVLGRSSGGIGRHVAQIVSSLDGRDGMVIDVCAPADLGVPMPKQAIAIDIPDGMSSGHLSTIRNLKEIIRAGAYTVVHAHGLRAGLDASLAARSTGARPVVTLHNLIRPETSGRVGSVLFRRAETILMMLARKVFAVSREMAERLREHLFGREKVEVMYIGIAAPEVTRSRPDVRNEIGVAEHAPLVVTVARLARQKSLDVLLDAVANLPGVTLAIVGDGPLRGELESHRARLGITDRVHFLGHKEGVGDYVAAADCFALSSSWEARSLAAQEAILLRVPLVTTDVGGMSEIVTDRVSGRLTPAGDADALGAAIKEVLDDPAAARVMADKARLELTESFSTDEMLARLVAEYRGSDGDDR